MKSHAIHFLRWSEQYTKTDMTYLIGQSGWLILGQSAIFISSLLLAWVFANHVTPADYGLYKYVLSMATLAAITSLTGFGTAIARYTTKEKAISLKKLLKTQIRFGLLGTLGLFFFALYYFFLGNTLLASLFAVTAIWVPFYESLSGYQFLLQGKKDFKTQTYLRIVQRLLLSVAVIGIILYTKNIVIITLVYFAALTLTQYIVYRYTMYKYPDTDDTDTPYEKIISYGKRVSVQNIFLTGANQIDKIIMFKFLGPTQLAIYFFAIALPNEIQGVLGNINSVAFPKLVDKFSSKFKQALIKKIFLFTLLLTIPAGLYILIAPYLFTWLFPVYMSSVFISQLYIGTMLFIPASLLWHYFYAVEHQKALWYGTFIGPSTFIIGILVFVPLFGLIGAVLATYIRSLVDLAMALFFFFYKTKAD